MCYLSTLAFANCVVIISSILVYSLFTGIFGEKLCSLSGRKQNVNITYLRYVVHRTKYFLAKDEKRNSSQRYTHW